MTAVVYQELYLKFVTPKEFREHFYEHLVFTLFTKLQENLQKYIPEILPIEKDLKICTSMKIQVDNLVDLYYFY